jgi:hypothetical protein
MEDREREREKYHERRTTNDKTDTNVSSDSAEKSTFRFKLTLIHKNMGNDEKEYYRHSLGKVTEVEER